MNKIALAPTSLPNAQPMEYVEAARKAGYEAIGLRTFRSPGNTYPFHPVVDDPTWRAMSRRRSRIRVWKSSTS